MHYHHRRKINGFKYDQLYEWATCHVDCSISSKFIWLIMLFTRHLTRTGRSAGQMKNKSVIKWDMSAQNHSSETISTLSVTALCAAYKNTMVFLPSSICLRVDTLRISTRFTYSKLYAYTTNSPARDKHARTARLNSAHLSSICLSYVATISCRPGGWNQLPFPMKTSSVTLNFTSLEFA